MTHCNQTFAFSSMQKRQLVVDFQGGAITTDGGAIWLREVDRKLGLIDRLTDCLHDPRDSRRVRHTLSDLLRQRIFQIALGYEDANDAETLRKDPALKIGCHRDPHQEDLASQPTLSRLENSVDNDDLQRLLKGMVDHYVEHRETPHNGWIVFDVDATDDETHGQQEFAGFHAYYGHYCYLPLLIHDGHTGDLIVPLLRPGRVSAKLGADGILLYLAERVREKWPDVRVLVRGDSGYCGELLYEQLEAAGIDYVFGIARNARLQALAEPLMKPARLLSFLADRKMTAFAWGEYQAEGWDRARKVVVKAERLLGKDNPRFLVTTLEGDPGWIYRKLYCIRGESSENRIKDLMNGCRADRLSCHRFTGNFFRLILHSAAYILLHQLRRELEAGDVDRMEITTLRLKVLKVGGRIRRTCRKIWVHLASGYPYRQLWEVLHQRLVLA